MPYIHPDRRKELDKGLTAKPMLEGELNYCVTKLAAAFIHAWGPSYSSFNAAIGALEAAKLELYRRRVAPYEDDKIRENGDVY